MFTGLVETVGKVISVLPNGDVWRLDISAPQIAEELKLGDSVADSQHGQHIIICVELLVMITSLRFHKIGSV